MSTEHENEPVLEDAPKAVENDTEERAVDTTVESRSRRAEMLRGTAERREFVMEGLECRSLEDGTIRMAGYGSVTEHFYDVGDPERGGFRERISRNAFKRTLSEQPDVVLLVNHEGLPLARTKNGSLVLSEDARGLRWQADLDGEDPDSRSLSRRVEQGLLDQCSFAFRCDADSWDDAYSERTIKSLSLHRGDVSIVTHGANEATSVTTLRSVVDGLEERVGKEISAKNRTELEAMRDSITRLLGDDEAADDTEASDDEAVETSEPVAAPARSVVMPDYTMRDRERLAQLRRAA